VTLVAPHSQDEEAGGVRVLAVPPTAPWRPARATFRAFRVWRRALETGADIFHFHDPELIPAGLMLKLLGKRVVYDAHEDLPEAIRSKEYIPAVLRPLVSIAAGFFEKTACRFFDAVVTATPAIGDNFKPYNRRTVAVCNFPARDEFPVTAGKTWNAREYAVAYLGVIADIRGLDRMLEAVSMIPGDPAPTLILAGRFYPESLAGKINTLPGGDRVRWLGHLDRAGVARVLGSVRTGLVLLDPEERFKVAYPIKMFEYMAAGIPVIASDFPLWRRIITEAGCGLLADPLNPKAIAEAIEYILTHPREAEAMGRLGREAVATKYNWEGERDKLLALYQSLEA
jgi:glycosyltransferase involved in cell wall biosynthesis